ncbi:helix-turn-helix domain-containing protein [Pedobacter zeae]|uniref:AraC family transcriptional regulator n=1 Tax=Pedobacter zeae TaxID=1737356 RepID=A0A7W6P6N4_9SPHI|nr:helix-turn-helix domain-containing protein [Pedobacter zeae]MBB4109342.1 AraC-like DNA-binding protein/mannose-6-phosphate isomerase-like protein (cupin superfamily) [Pedobacter zeae]GGH11678.1 AraC family transcriptional regulator [Pedobacter zeae]
MTRKSKSIPLKPLAKEFDNGIAVGKYPIADLRLSEEAEYSHRHDYHFFILQEKGTSYFEIDFEKHQIKKPSIIYIAPNQVHSVLKAENIEFCLLAINNENLHPQYLKLLEEISPAKPLTLSSKHISLISQTFLLCIDLFEEREGKLYLSSLKDSCNTLISLFLSQYLERSGHADTLSRFELVTKAFKLALEQNFIKNKRPADYAQKLNISVPYLNECVKNTTGFPVSYHIQRRVTLEAKRLLFHSNKSVKEIAAELGYDDYAYFSRLFNKATGMTALTFRNKNRD